MDRERHRMILEHRQEIAYGGSPQLQLQRTGGITLQHFGNLELNFRSDTMAKKSNSVWTIDTSVIS